MKREVSKEELLRLARKAWPADSLRSVLPWIGIVVTDHGEHLMSINNREAPAAMHVALQQLAGELEPGSVEAVLFAYWLLTGRRLKHFEGERGWDVEESGPEFDSADLSDSGFCLWLDEHAPEGLKHG